MMRFVTAFAWLVLVTILPASGQTVTFADLDGATVETSLSYENTVRWNDRLVSTKSRTDRKIILGPGETGRGEWTMTSQGPRGTRTTAPAWFAFTLGQPKEVTGLGGGHILWVFNDGVLTMLRTYKVGGFKTSISFTRRDGDLACSIEAPHLREVGAGNIRRDSAFGGDWEIISAKQVSSACNVRKN